MLGFFLVFNANLQRLVGRWTESAELSVYLADDVTPEELTTIDDARGEERSGLEPSSTSRRPQAADRFTRDFPDLAPSAARLENNPFPASFEVRLDPGQARARDAVDALATTLAGVHGVGRRPLRPALARRG